MVREEGPGDGVSRAGMGHQGTPARRCVVPIPGPSPCGLPGGLPQPWRGGVGSVAEAGVCPGGGPGAGSWVGLMEPPTLGSGGGLSRSSVGR